MSLGLFEVIDDSDGSLLAMIHGTRTTDTYCSDAAIEIDSHEPRGSTVCIHALCVHPAWRARGFGTKILREYIGRLKNDNTIERIALIAHDELVPFYERYELW